MRDWDSEIIFSLSASLFSEPQVFKRITAGFNADFQPVYSILASFLVKQTRDFTCSCTYIYNVLLRSSIIPHNPRNSDHQSDHEQ